MMRMAYKLQPTLWRTCRVLANKTRLEMLYLLFDSEELCNRELAAITGLSEAQVSIHLRLLNSRGLIRQRRSGMNLLSSAEPNQEIQSASLLLKALELCHSRKVSIETLFRQATSFTHARRIEIVQKIPGEGITNRLLSEKTGIAISAINRHLHKLKTRHFVNDHKGVYTVSQPEDALSRTLLQIVRNT
jgi:DNA-binding transcriptional ArsR family regulator